MSATAGFRIEAAMHPAGKVFRAFPNGIWFGYIDGASVTAPHHSAAMAMNEAAAILASGNYGEETKKAGVTSIASS